VGRLKFEAAPDVQAKANELVSRLGMEHIDCSRLRFMRSRGSKGGALARIWEMPRIWQLALGIRPHYVIEVIAERFDRMSEEEKAKTVLHELMHIPKNFSGAVLSHRRASFDGKGGHRIEKINSGTVERMLRQITG